MIGEDVAARILPLLGGLGGVTLIYCTVMVGLSIRKNKRLARIESMLLAPVELSAEEGDGAEEVYSVGPTADTASNNSELPSLYLEIMGSQKIVLHVKARSITDAREAMLFLLENHGRVSELRPPRGDR